MRNVLRSAVPVTAALAVALVATPSFAATTSTVPTSLNARAAKSEVAPRHHDTVHLTLRSRHAGVTGEADHFLVRSRRDNGTAKWSHWRAVTATPGTDAGRYRITVTLPAKIGHGKKEQYQVRFDGDAAKHLRASRSEVFTVTAR